MSKRTQPDVDQRSGVGMRGYSIHGDITVAELRNQLALLPPKASVQIMLESGEVYRLKAADPPVHDGDPCWLWAGEGPL